QPDGMFASYDAIRDGRVRQVPGRSGGFTELGGAPEMVLEIISDSSIEKDTVRLPEVYLRAGVAEFWRIDARGGELRFEILRREEAGYVPALGEDGWWRSEVFGHWFRLVQQPNPLGHPSYTLESRP
ncbi:MAG TPA: Uma2 family endonuclease, partial [Gemmataceae bacterium]